MCGDWSRDSLFSAYEAAHPRAQNCKYFMNNGSCSGVQACWERAKPLRDIVATDQAKVEQTLLELTGMKRDDWDRMARALAGDKPGVTQLVTGHGVPAPPRAPRSF